MEEEKVIIDYIYPEVQKRIEDSVEGIKLQYFSKDNNIPWLIGYSGGKDSTCTAQLVFRALIELKKAKKKLERKVYIFSADTMIENPIVKDIVDENILLINKKAKELNLPVEALILKPEIEKTFWVNIIGRGYPTPNTMFRWCTDRLKIDPANNFIHRCIDKNGEVIMVLGVREGESNTRDRVLKTHSIEGEKLMKHTTLANAYVYPPIKYLSTQDIFYYLQAYASPWGSNNKKLYFFYEESGGGECPMFISQQDKTSSNSCGNTRFGCWVCTVVGKDKSLSGFINTGFYDHLKPLLDFRNWLTSIRDDDNYRCHYRNNGSVYLKKILTKKDKNGIYLSIPKKGDREKIEIRLDSEGNIINENNDQYLLIDKDDLNKYMKKNNLTFKSVELANLILQDHITKEYFKLGTGPYTSDAKKEIFEKLIETEYKYNSLIDKKVMLITDEEIVEIKKMWLKSAIDISFIDKVLAKYGRNKVDVVRDSFELINEKYEHTIKRILKKNNLDYEIVNKLVLNEKELLVKDSREEMQHVISTLFNADKSNY